MIFALTVVSTWLLLWQAAEGVSAPQINIEPNQSALTAVLDIPSAKVNGIERLAASDIGYVYQVGGSVTPPRIRYQTSPEFQEKARKAKHTGTVVVRAVVGPDGKVHDARVVRRLGWGLDEKALEAVKQWVFEPSTKDGHNVAVYVDIEINFRLY